MPVNSQPSDAKYIPSDENRIWNYESGGGVTENKINQGYYGAEAQRWRESIGEQIGLGQDALSQAASGQSVAQQQLRMGLAQNQAAMAGQAAARGADPLAARTALMAGSNAASQMNAQAGLLRSQEMMGARGFLADQLGKETAGLQNIFALNQQRNIAQAQHHAQMTQLNMGDQDDTFQKVMQGIGTAATVAGAAAAFSDEAYKKGISNIPLYPDASPEERARVMRMREVEAGVNPGAARARWQNEQNANRAKWETDQERMGYEGLRGRGRDQSWKDQWTWRNLGDEPISGSMAPPAWADEPGYGLHDKYSQLDHGGKNANYQMEHLRRLNKGGYKGYRTEVARHRKKLREDRGPQRIKKGTGRAFYTGSEFQKNNALMDLYGEQGERLRNLEPSRERSWPHVQGQEIERMGAALPKGDNKPQHLPRGFPEREEPAWWQNVGRTYFGEMRDHGGPVEAAPRQEAGIGFSIPAKYGEKPAPKPAGGPENVGTTAQPLTGGGGGGDTAGAIGAAAGAAGGGGEGGMDFGGMMKGIGNIAGILGGGEEKPPPQLSSLDIPEFHPVQGNMSDEKLKKENRILRMAVGELGKTHGEMDVEGEGAERTANVGRDPNEPRGQYYVDALGSYPLGGPISDVAKTAGDIGHYVRGAYDLPFSPRFRSPVDPYIDEAKEGARAVWDRNATAVREAYARAREGWGIKGGQGSGRLHRAADEMGVSPDELGLRMQKAGLMSDESLKRILTANPQSRQLGMAALTAAAPQQVKQQLIDQTPFMEYEYNDEAQRVYGMPPGRRVGTGARALNQAGPIGQAVTQEAGPGGPMTIKPDEGVGAALGMSAEIGRQQKEQEQRLELVGKKLDAIGKALEMGAFDIGDMGSLDRGRPEQLGAFDRGQMRKLHGIGATDAGLERAVGQAANYDRGRGSY